MVDVVDDDVLRTQRGQRMNDNASDFVDDEPLIPLGAAVEDLDHAREVFVLEERARLERAVRSSTPTHAVEAERELVGLALRVGHDVVASVDGTGLRAADFTSSALRETWSAVCAVDARGEPVDVLPVVDELTRRGTLDAAGGHVAIARLQAQSAFASASLAPWNARLITEKARLRRVMLILDECRLRASVGERPDVVCDSAISQLADVANNGGSVTASVDAAMRELASQTPLLGGSRSGESTGFLDVDKLFRLTPGALYVVAARPAMGKTSFALNIASSFALHRNLPVHLFSLEMSASELLGSVLQAEARVSLRADSARPGERTRLVDAQAKILDAPLYIDESAAVTIGDIRAKARALAARVRPRLLVVDYIQLVGASSPSDNRANDVGEVSRGLKQIARELQVPVIALSQLNRSVEQRADKRPMMSDLRESGAIEQDADVIAFLYREDYYLREKTPEDRRGLAEVIVDKNRRGPTGSATLRWFGAWTRFDNAARGQ